MGGAVFQRSRAFEAAPKPRAESRPLPRGYGLLIGATASLGLWTGIFWLAAKAFG